MNFSNIKKFEFVLAIKSKNEGGENNNIDD
jgi:hypothetical protein